MARGTVRAASSADESRNKHQSVTLLEAIDEFEFDACIGGARRDEEKARAKERIFSFRDEFGQWDPKNQRPELWDLYNARVLKGENIRAFPISNWTELDVWQYIAARAAGAALDLLRAPRAGGAPRAACCSRCTDLTPARDGEDRGAPDGALPHRRRHHLHRAGRIGRRHRRRRSSPKPPLTTITERGATRLDDQTSEASMEQRKKEGYF